MQGIYTYIPDTNYVPTEYRVADILLLLFMVLILLLSVLNLLYFYISTLLLLLLFISTLVQGICSYIPETIRASRVYEYSVASTL